MYVVFFVDTQQQARVVILWEMMLWRMRSVRVALMMIRLGLVYFRPKMKMADAELLAHARVELVSLVNKLAS